MSEQQSYQVTATPRWPPIAIPGRPGWYRHYLNGRQVDLPTSDTPTTDRWDEDIRLWSDID